MDDLYQLQDQNSFRSFFPLSTQCSCLGKHNPSMAGDSLFSYSYLRDMRWWWGHHTWGITSVYLGSPGSCTTSVCYYKSSLGIINHHREEPFQQGLFSYVRSVLVLWIYQSNGSGVAEIDRYVIFLSLLCAFSGLLGQADPKSSTCMC